MTTIARGVRGDGSPREQGVPGDRSPGPAQIAALIAEAPTPRPTLLRTFNAMMAREFRVLRRNAIIVLMSVELMLNAVAVNLVADGLRPQEDA